MRYFSHVFICVILILFSTNCFDDNSKKDTNDRQNTSKDTNNGASDEENLLDESESSETGQNDVISTPETTKTTAESTELSIESNDQSASAETISTESNSPNIEAKTSATIRAEVPISTIIGRSDILANFLPEPTPFPTNMIDSTKYFPDNLEVSNNLFIVPSDQVELLPRSDLINRSDALSSFFKKSTSSEFINIISDSFTHPSGVEAVVIHASDSSLLSNIIVSPMAEIKLSAYTPSGDSISIPGSIEGDKIIYEGDVDTGNYLLSLDTSSNSNEQKDNCNAIAQFSPSGFLTTIDDDKTFTIQTIPFTEKDDFGKIKGIPEAITEESVKTISISSIGQTEEDYSHVCARVIDTNVKFLKLTNSGILWETNTTTYRKNALIDLEESLFFSHHFDFESSIDILFNQFETRAAYITRNGLNYFNNHQGTIGDIKADFAYDGTSGDEFIDLILFINGDADQSGDVPYKDFFSINGSKQTSSEWSWTLNTYPGFEFPSYYPEDWDLNPIHVTTSGYGFFMWESEHSCTEGFIGQSCITNYIASKNPIDSKWYFPTTEEGSLTANYNDFDYKINVESIDNYGNAFGFFNENHNLPSEATQLRGIFIGSINDPSHTDPIWEWEYIDLISIIDPDFIHEDIFTQYGPGSSPNDHLIESVRLNNAGSSLIITSSNQFDQDIRLFSAAWGEYDPDSFSWTWSDLATIDNFSTSNITEIFNENDISNNGRFYTPEVIDIALDNEEKNAYVLWTDYIYDSLDYSGSKSGESFYISDYNPLNDSWTLNSYQFPSLLSGQTDIFESHGYGQIKLGINQNDGIVTLPRCTRIDDGSIVLHYIEKDGDGNWGEIEQLLADKFHFFTNYYQTENYLTAVDDGITCSSDLNVSTSIMVDDSGDITIAFTESVARKGYQGSCNYSGCVTKWNPGSQMIVMFKRRNGIWLVPEYWAVD